MEKFYKTRELVAFCCSDGSNFPSPEDYLSDYFDEKTANFGKKLPDGSFHGSFTEFYENFTETSTYDRGVKHGPWSKVSKKALCRGDFVNGKPEGEFIISQKVEIPSNKWPKNFRTSFSSVFYEKGKAVKHVHCSKDNCPFECSFMGAPLRGPHKIEWKIIDKIWFELTTENTKLEGCVSNTAKGCDQLWNSLWCWSEILPAKAKRFSPPNEGEICFVVP
uniref:MORN repeat-containing protein n=1 Tax=Marseillevirus sp. TaxID=2809551 RepID=A0AA96ERS7_9VIRU|nr:hypothetical protein MarFTMF_326 [Marseillevirus sp.]